tara:strand:- start:3009 stop:3518 length:510 start_codon:yes stop_codon:yes gene_type:complete
MVDANQLANMPLEDLEAMLMEESQKLSDLLATGGPETIPAAPMDEPMAEQDPMMMEEEIPEMTSSPIMNEEVPLDMLSPDIIQSASTALVEAGFLDKATNEMSPELIEVFQGVADLLSPGIYNLNNDSDLMEFVNGIANGTVPITGLGGAGTGAAAGNPAQPAPAGPII